jgi:UDP-N-acetylmuramoylalanine--D-glutamate ligase
MAQIVILGGGESGVGAARLAQAKGHQVFLSDQGELKAVYQAELNEYQIPFETGTHTLERILAADEIIISPGIPEKSELVQAIKKQGISLISEIEFAARYTDAKLIAITGSNGKTTTTLLTYHLLKEAGYQVGLAGNIGHSFAKQVMEQSFDWYVLEISSFQLDRCFEFSPDIAVLVNITPDHLDRYDYKFENYIHSKFRIFQNAKAANTCIYWGDDEVIQQYKSLIPTDTQIQEIHFSPAQGSATITEEEIIFEDGSIQRATAPIQGPHNAMNMSAAILAAKSAGVSWESIVKHLPTFQNAPHRLEPCGNWQGVQFINDSKATNVDAVYYALNSFTKPIILIIGGVDKGNDYRVLDELVKNRVKGMVCLGTDNSKLEAHFGKSVALFAQTNQLENAIKQAMDWANSGDVILLSPACASFDLFKNYEDRGDQFKATVKHLIHGI